MGSWRLIAQLPKAIDLLEAHCAALRGEAEAPPEPGAGSELEAA